MMVFRNAGQLKFDDVSNTSGVNDEPLQSRRGIAFGDLNNDGNIDAVVFNCNGPPSILINDTKNANHSRHVQAGGHAKQSSRPSGTRHDHRGRRQRRCSEVKGGNSYLSQSDLRLHFGLGKETEDREGRKSAGRMERPKN